jgi:hypothetical protein
MPTFLITCSLFQDAVSSSGDKVASGLNIKSERILKEVAMG